MYLSDYATREGVPVFQNIADALQHAIQLVQSPCWLNRFLLFYLFFYLFHTSKLIDSMTNLFNNVQLPFEIDAYTVGIIMVIMLYYHYYIYKKRLLIITIYAVIGIRCFSSWCTLSLSSHWYITLMLLTHFSLLIMSLAFIVLLLLSILNSWQSWNTSNQDFSIYVKIFFLLLLFITSAAFLEQLFLFCWPLNVVLLFYV